jgi:ATP adenylyltransferase
MTERLYAPWRQEFIFGPKEEGCIFCDPDSRKNVRDWILHRGKTAFVVMNRYPYNSGHLMVVPYRHVADLHNLRPSERREIMDLVVLSSRVLTEVHKPAGINMGMNLGRAAGAGIDGHLHVHLVPRWVGDTNFLPVLFDTRIISVDLHAMCRRLKAAFRKATKSKKRS